MTAVVPHSPHEVAPLRTSGEVLPRVLVLGATGTQGGAVARHLSGAGQWAVVAVTRSPASAKARALAQLPRTTVARCDPNDEAALAALFAAQAPLHGVYSVQANDMSPKGCRLEKQQGKQVVDLCKAHAVRHLVYSSVANLEPAAQRDIATKAVIEEHLRASGVPFTILRPTYFVENFFAGGISPATASAVGYPGFDVASRVKQRFIWVDDVGMVAAAVLAGGERWVGDTLDLAGDELTPAELVSVFSEHNGRAMRAQTIYPMCIFSVLCCVPGMSDAKLLYTFMRTRNWEVDVPALRAQFPQLHTVKDALRAAEYLPPRLVAVPLRRA